MLNSILAICIGASAGAMTRWGLMNAFNHTFPNLPLGTLLANLLGGYLIGLIIAFAAHSSLSHEWRLLIVVGFLGSLTTFSGFSAEVVGLMQQEKLGWAFSTVLMHTVGAITMTFLGLATVKLVKSFI